MADAARRGRDEAPDGTLHLLRRCLCRCLCLSPALSPSRVVSFSLSFQSFPPLDFVSNSAMSMPYKRGSDARWKRRTHRKHALVRVALHRTFVSRSKLFVPWLFACRYRVGLVANHAADSASGGADSQRHGCAAVRRHGRPPAARIRST